MGRTWIQRFLEIGSRTLSPRSWYDPRNHSTWSHSHVDCLQEKRWLKKTQICRIRGFEGAPRKGQGQISLNQKKSWIHRWGARNHQIELWNQWRKRQENRSHIKRQLQSIIEEINRHGLCWPRVLQIRHQIGCSPKRQKSQNWCCQDAIYSIRLLQGMEELLICSYFILRSFKLLRPFS